MYPVCDFGSQNSTYKYRLQIPTLRHLTVMADKAHYFHYGLPRFCICCDGITTLDPLSSTWPSVHYALPIAAKLCKCAYLSITGGPKLGSAKLQPNNSAELGCYSALFFLHVQHRTLQLFTLIFLVHHIFCIYLAFNLPSTKIRKSDHYTMNYSILMPTKLSNCIYGVTLYNSK